MTRREDRQTLVAAIAEACAAGARLAPACSLAGIDRRSFQRWRDDHGQVRADRRPEATRPQPAHALSEAERARIVELANQPRFASTPPARIVPALAETRASMSPARPASTVCCASMARCVAGVGPARRSPPAHPARMWPPPRDRSGAGT